MSVRMKGISYACSGAVIGFIAGIWVFGASEAFTYLLAAIYGVVGGLLHFFVLFFLKRIFR
ncbi:hypothetical protein [Sporosarcina cyprini]|uniref:hypothetical protein n=1 Tax=Sporosarcina cyprini TaxID=2910523 RepID=UPI001EE144E1|nr:hypothetical protein [Sporosarcina cyprini]MCG3088980.1 hypothetical protein [Sporosarcina cyprini]